MAEIAQKKHLLWFYTIKKQGEIQEIIAVDFRRNSDAMLTEVSGLPDVKIGEQQQSISRPKDSFLGQQPMLLSEYLQG
jgi:hypothetical protein